MILGYTCMSLFGKYQAKQYLMNTLMWTPAAAALEVKFALCHCDIAGKIQQGRGGSKNTYLAKKKQMLLSCSTSQTGLLWMSLGNRLPS